MGKYKCKFSIGIPLTCDLLQFNDTKHIQNNTLEKNTLEIQFFSSIEEAIQNIQKRFTQSRQKNINKEEYTKQVLQTVDGKTYVLRSLQTTFRFEHKPNSKKTVLNIYELQYKHKRFQYLTRKEFIKMNKKYSDYCGIHTITTKKKQI